MCHMPRSAHELTSRAVASDQKWNTRGGQSKVWNLQYLSFRISQTNEKYSRHSANRFILRARLKPAVSSDTNLDLLQQLRHSSELNIAELQATPISLRLLDPSEKLALKRAVLIPQSQAALYS